MAKVPPVVQDTQEALAVIGANAKRWSRKLIALTGELEKLMGEFERLNRFTERQELQIKELAEEYAKSSNGKEDKK